MGIGSRPESSIQGFGMDFGEAIIWCSGMSRGCRSVDVLAGSRLGVLSTGITVLTVALDEAAKVTNSVGEEIAAETASATTISEV